MLHLLPRNVPVTRNICGALPPPSVLGRTYDTPHRNAPSIRCMPTTKSTENREQALCIHGLGSGCSICLSPPAVRRPVSRTVTSSRADVFARLRLLLLPPLLEKLNVPGVLAHNPYEFQIQGIRWLLEHPKALLADEMGLGKTMQAILAIRVLFQRGKLSRVLVVAPVSVGATWEREIRTWAPELTAVRVQGSQVDRDAHWRTEGEVYIVSYESLRGDTQRHSFVTSIPFDLCVADEAQKIKNPSARTTQCVRQVSKNCIGRWALTGTPLENSINDTISVFEFIDPTMGLSRLNVVRSRYERQQFGQEYARGQSLRQAISPRTLRRTKSQVSLQLPELRHDVHWLELASRQRQTYVAAEQAGIDGLERLGEQATRVHIFALINQLKLLCNLDEVSEQSSKLDFLEDVLDEITLNGEKALVFSQYPHKTLSKIAGRLHRFRPLRFDGSVAGDARERIVDQFQQQDENAILLMGIRSGGLGTTLTRANHVFHFDHWWNPAIVDQGSARVHRIGQKRSVFIHSLYTQDTVEERIYELLSHKRQLFQNVFGDLEDEQVVNRLTDEELFGLFGLKPPTRTPIEHAPTRRKAQLDRRQP